MNILSRHNGKYESATLPLPLRETGAVYKQPIWTLVFISQFSPWKLPRSSAHEPACQTIKNMKNWSKVLQAKLTVSLSNSWSKDLRRKNRNSSQWIHPCTLHVQINRKKRWRHDSIFSSKSPKGDREKIWALRKAWFRFHRSIFGTLKVSLQAFALERSLCESCERLAKGIDKIRVILKRPSKKTPPVDEHRMYVSTCFYAFVSIACRIFSI